MVDFHTLVQLTQKKTNSPNNYMFNTQPAMEQPSNEKKYRTPDTTDIKSWSDEKLKSESAKLNAEHKGLVENMMREDKKTPNAEIVREIKRLAELGREMFYELEKRKHPLNS